MGDKFNWNPGKDIVGALIAYLFPSADSTTAIQIRKADKSTVVLNIDTTNGDVYTAKGTWTPTWTGLTVTGSPTYTGNYTKIGRLVYWDVIITPNGGTTASSVGSTYINNMPFVPAAYAPFWALDMSTFANLSSGMGRIPNGGTNAYVPSWTANGDYIIFQGWYRTS